MKGPMGAAHFWKARCDQSRERLQGEARQACRVSHVETQGHSQEHAEGDREPQESAKQSRTPPASYVENSVLPDGM